MDLVTTEEGAKPVVKAVAVEVTVARRKKNFILLLCCLLIYYVCNDNKL